LITSKSEPARKIYLLERTQEKKKRGAQKLGKKDRREEKLRRLQGKRPGEASPQIFPGTHLRGFEDRGGSTREYNQINSPTG